MTSRSWFRASLASAALLLLAVPAAMAQGVEAPRLPLRTALDELNTVRTEYAEAFNAKNAAAVTDMYAEDAMLVSGDGTLLKGKAAIGMWLADGAKGWPHMVIESDSVRVYGRTAVDVGTLRMHPEGGAEQVARYMVVLRRGMRVWKVVSVASVPVAAAPK
jgi:uncharacterized protein (TIGR02246 family)